MSLQAASSGPDGLSDGLDRCLWYGPSLDDEEAWGEPPDEDLLPEEPALPDDAYEGIDWLSATDAGSVPDRFDQALGRLRAAAEDLVELGSDPGLVLAGRDRLIGWARGLEQARNQLACPDQALINLMEASGCRIDGPLGMFVSPQAYLHALQGIGLGAARARVRAAGALAPTQDLTGRRVQPRFPVLAAAQQGGEIGPDRIDQAVKALTEWQKLVDLEASPVTAEALRVVEETLAGQARVFGGPQLAEIIDRLGAYLNPDGMVDDRPGQDAVRSFELRPVSRGLHKGMYRAEGWLTAEAGPTGGTGVRGCTTPWTRWPTAACAPGSCPLMVARRPRGRVKWSV